MGKNLHFLIKFYFYTFNKGLEINKSVISCKCIYVKGEIV